MGKSKTMTGRLLRLAGLAVAALLVLLAIGLGMLGFTSFGARFVVERVASAISNRDMTVTIRDPQPLLTGHLRSGPIILSDTRGVFARIESLSIDWNPLALISRRFSARKIALGPVDVYRKPVRTLPDRPQDQQSGFSLPVTLTIAEIDLPDIELAPALVGRGFLLAAKGRLVAGAEGGNGALEIRRQNVPDAKLTAAVDYRPDSGRLMLDASLAEPKGGLLAAVLALPNNPALAMTLTGDGPISDWVGQLKAAVDGQQRATLDARHRLGNDGIHHVEVKGGGDLNGLVPASFRPLVPGQTTLDLAANFDQTGRIDIQTGNLATGSLVVAASGTVDPAGKNSLNANVLGTTGPVDLRWPLSAGGEARLMMSGLNLALTGDARAARLSASLSLDSARLPQASLGSVKVTAKSDSFNLSNRTGAVQLRLVASDTDFANADLERILTGPVTVVLPLQISPDSYGFNGASISSAFANAALNGSYRTTGGQLTGTVQLGLQPAALPPAVSARLRDPISLTGQIAGTPGAKISLSNLALKSGPVDATGHVTLDGEALEAAMSGRLAEIGRVIQGAEGGIDFSLAANGPLSRLPVEAKLDAKDLTMAGRRVERLALTLSGLADSKAPQANLTATGSIEGKEIGIDAALQSEQGRIVLPRIKATVGGNRIDGMLSLSQEYLPSGRLTFDLPDLSLLAALGGQTAAGDLKGSADLSETNGRAAIRLTANGSGLRSGAFLLEKPDIDLSVTDLAGLKAEGSIKAQSVGVETNALQDVTLSFQQAANRTQYALNADYDGSPLLAKGFAESNAGSIRIGLDQFSARPKAIPVELASPTAIMIENGTVILNGLTLSTGGGSLSVTGRAGKELALDAGIDRMPASVAGSLMPSLALGGTVSGKAVVTGSPAAPHAEVSLDWRDAVLLGTKEAGLPPLTVNADGTFDNGRLNFSLNALDGKSALLAAKGGLTLIGTGAKPVDATADLSRLPASLANRFLPDLGVEGLVSGHAVLSGNLPAPKLDFTLDWKEASLAATRKAGLSALSVDAKGVLENNVLDAEAKAKGADGLLLTSTAHSVLDGAGKGAIEAKAVLAKLPARLANAYLPQLGAEGLISADLTASGTLDAPKAELHFAWTDAATAESRRANIKGLGLSGSARLVGDALDGTLNLVGEGGIAVDAKGNARLQGQKIDGFSADAALTRLPAALANAALPSLAAEGSVSGHVQASGSLERPAAMFDLSWKDAATSQTKSAGLSGLDVTAKGTLQDQTLSAQAAANRDGKALLKAQATAVLQGSAVSNLDATATLTDVPADLANGFMQGLDASGLVSGTAKATGTLPRPDVDFTLAWGNAETRQTRSAGLPPLALAATGRYRGDHVDFDAKLTAAEKMLLQARGGLALAGGKLGDLTIDADIADLPASLANGFVPGLAAEGRINGTARSTGPADNPVVDFRLAWTDAGLAQTKAAGLAGLNLDLQGKLAEGLVTAKAALSGSGISIKADGSYGLSGAKAGLVDARADIANVPASLANGFVPDLDAAGRITGTVNAAGPVLGPTGNFSLAWADAATKQTRAAGVSALALKADGEMRDGLVTAKAALSGSGISIKADGSYGLSGAKAGTIDARATIANLPASLANGFVPGLGAEGRISGTASASGGIAGASGHLPLPDAKFDLDWTGAALAQTRSAGVAPLGLKARGTLNNGMLDLDATASGAAGLTLRSNGRVGLAGARPLDLKLNGRLPFGLLASQLASQGLVASGAAEVNLTIGGTVAAPAINGTLTTSGASVTDVRRNLSARNIAASIAFDGRQARITRLTTSLASGGTITVTGSVGIDPAAGLPANIDIRLNRAVYVDGTLVVATVDGAVTLSGPLLTGPKLSGTLKLDKASITVPEKLPSSLRQVDIKHKNAPPAVRAQLGRLRDKAPQQKSGGLTLDLVLDAPSQIFVRGRGIDAELGGRIVITGTAAQPNVLGGFTLRRGRLTILNRRLDFSDKSRITFAGNLTPALDMTASSASGSATLSVNVAGLATDPDISFSSSPALPQDEVLAQLIFGQSLSKLSPVQIAQLADAVGQLAGGRSTSVFQGLRNSLGVDDLDISTDSKGQTSVSVGRYLNDRTYFELQQSGSGGPKAVINLDVGRGVKLRAGAGGDGAGEAGVVYEREY